jgi:hypothetical protein
MSGGYNEKNKYLNILAPWFQHIVPKPTQHLIPKGTCANTIGDDSINQKKSVFKWTMPYSNMTQEQEVDRPDFKMIGIACLTIENTLTETDYMVDGEDLIMKTMQ